MQIERLDHFVLTTENLEKCLAFYRDILHMRVEETNGRYALRFGRQKINIHTRKAEFLPAAMYPVSGSLDFCLVVKGPLDKVKEEILASGYLVEEGPCRRHGACGPMESLYLRDPDGNLVELSVYGNDAEAES